VAMTTARLLHSPYCLDSHTEMVRIAADGEIDAADPGTARPELATVLRLLEKVTLDPDGIDAADVARVRDAGVPDDAITDALHVNLIWNVVNRLANAFDFRLLPGQLEKGTRSLHRFGYRFPGFLAGTTRHTRVHEALVANLRHAVLDGPGHTDPATRSAAATGGPLPQPWQSYAAQVRDASHQVSDADLDALKAAGHSEDEIFEITAAAAVGAALHSLDAGLRALRGG